VSENLKRRALSVRRDDFKYTLRYRQDRGVEEQLFDLGRDPGETRDVTLAQAEVLARLQVLAAQHWLQTRPGPFVLVLGNDAVGRLDLSLRADGPLRGVERLLGPRGRPAGKGGFRFQGTGRGPVLLATRALAPAGAKLAIEVSAPAGKGTAASPLRRASIAQCAAELGRPAAELRVLVCE